MKFCSQKTQHANFAFFHIIIETSKKYINKNQSQIYLFFVFKGFLY